MTQVPTRAHATGRSPSGGSRPANQTSEPRGFGHEVLGPVVAEFCFGLWSVASLMEDPDATAFAFCARGGLRLQLAYETFLTSTGLSSPVTCVPLMVSRLAALRPVVARSLVEGLDHLLPSAASTTSYEFSGGTVADAARRLSGTDPRHRERWQQPFEPGRLLELLRHTDGRAVADTTVEQARLFGRHIELTLAGRCSMVLVDTGLLGTTGWLVTEGLPHLNTGSLLLARSRFRTIEPTVPTFGLSLDTTGYSPLRRRSALLRHWHFVEWLFEPDLPSVRTFVDVDGTPRSNLEVEGWQQRLPGEPHSAFAGVLSYLEQLGPNPMPRLGPETDAAWSRLRRALVWPRPDDALALSPGERTHDFGSDAAWTARPVTASVLEILRGSSMWREGEVARLAPALRWPVLAGIEAAYAARLGTRRLRSFLPDAPRGPRRLKRTP